MSLATWFYPTGQDFHDAGKTNIYGLGTNKFLSVNYAPSVNAGHSALSINHSPLIADDLAPSVKIASGYNVQSESLQIIREYIGNFLSLNYQDEDKLIINEIGSLIAQGSISGGSIEIPVGNQVLDLEQGNYYYSTPDGNAVWTVSGGREGLLAYIQVDNSGGHTVTFGSGFTNVSAITDTGIVNKLLYYDLDNTTWREIATGGGGTDDHGELEGLEDDDHTQYILANGTRNIIDNGYLNFGITNGTSGYGFRDNGGRMQCKHEGEDWADVGELAVDFGDSWT